MFMRLASAVSLGLIAVPATGCGVSPTDCTADDACHVSGGATPELYQGAQLWQQHTIVYCFEEPQLADLPASVTAVVSTQAELDQRFYSRVWEFIGAIDTTWQATQVVDLVPRNGCVPDAIPVHYRYQTTNNGAVNGGYCSGLGAGTQGIEMNVDFLGDTFASGPNTYHTFTAAHEMGHALGFRHEQDRPDSTCNVGRDPDGGGQELTPYDPDSIMNYCNTQATALTALDVQGFQSAYGFVDSLPNQCLDTNDQCAVWAARGECTNNPGYMLTSCCATCESSAACRDQNPQCSAWAADNQCNVNPDYMQPFCCHSCFGS
jgi:hypothetical protein